MGDYGAVTIVEDTQPHVHVVQDCIFCEIVTKSRMADVKYEVNSPSCLVEVCACWLTTMTPPDPLTG